MTGAADKVTASIARTATGSFISLFLGVSLSAPAIRAPQY
jgi:hypothetical protein